MPHRIANYCIENLNLQDAHLSDEYYYQSLPFCIIDAIYSIGVQYTSTRNTVKFFCGTQNLLRQRPSGSEHPPLNQQYSISEFLNLLDAAGPYDHIAQNYFNNRQRTSTRNGILKAEAVHRFTRTLSLHHINYFQDVGGITNNTIFEDEIRAIPGQTRGTSLKYFFMLAGDDNLIKPDRMIMRFLNRIIGKEATPQNAQTWLAQTIEILRQQFPQLTLRELDHEIWKYERGIA